MKEVDYKEVASRDLDYYRKEISKKFTDLMEAGNVGDFIKEFSADEEKISIHEAMKMYVYSALLNKYSILDTIGLYTDGGISYAKSEALYYAVLNENSDLIGYLLQQGISETNCAGLLIHFSKRFKEAKTRWIKKLILLNWKKI